MIDPLTLMLNKCRNRENILYYNNIVYNISVLW